MPQGTYYVYTARNKIYIPWYYSRNFFHKSLSKFIELAMFWQYCDFGIIKNEKNTRWLITDRGRVKVSRHRRHRSVMINSLAGGCQTLYRLIHWLRTNLHSRGRGREDIIKTQALSGGVTGATDYLIIIGVSSSYTVVYINIYHCVYHTIYVLWMVTIK